MNSCETAPAEVTPGCHDHASNAQDHAPDRALQSDSTHSLSDMKKFVNPAEHVVHQYRARRLGCHFASLAHCHADGGGDHRRRVVDSFTDVHGWVACRLLADNGDPHYQSKRTVTRLAEDAGLIPATAQGHWWFYTANFVKPDSGSCFVNAKNGGCGHQPQGASPQV